MLAFHFFARLAIGGGIMRKGLFLIIPKSTDEEILSEERGYQYLISQVNGTFSDLRRAYIIHDTLI